MTFNNREELLNRLWSNYRECEDNVESSFIYKYIKDRKNRKAIALAANKAQLIDYRFKSGRDRYILLRAASLAYKNKLIKKDELTDIFNEVVEKVKISKKKMPQDIDAAIDWLEKKMLKDAVGDFFTNNGFKKGAEDALENAFDNKNGGSRNLKKAKEKDEGNLDYIELAFVFAKALSGSKKLRMNEALPTEGITEEYIDKCRKLFALALESKSSEMLVPLYFDAQSGAGIFIVGNRVLKNAERKKCAPFIFWFWDKEPSEDLLNPEDSPTIPLLMNTKECQSIDDAFVNFSSERDGELYCDGYTVFNDRIPYKKADAVFRRLLRSREDLVSHSDYLKIKREKQEEEEEIRKLENSKKNFKDKSA